MTGNEQVLDYLTNIPAWYLATCEGDQPHVRPFSFAAEQDGKIWFCTATTKDVYRELEANPKFELSGWHPGHGWIILRGKTCCIAARAAMSCRFPRRAPWPATASSTPWAKRPLWPSAPRERAGPGPVRSGTCAAACRSFTSLTTDRRQARHCSPAERRGCRIFRRLSPCYGPSNCPFSMGNRTKSGKSKFSVDFDKAIVYNLRTTPKIMDLT